MRLFFLGFLAVFSMIPGTVRAGNGDHIVVAELFSSQGCGAARGAADFFDQLKAKGYENLILINCHVTFFDRNGYDFPYSNPLCDERRKNYKSLEEFMGPEGNPFFVVNGRYAERWDEKNKLLYSSVDMAQSVDEILPIQLDLRGDTLDLTLAEARTDKDLEVWLMAYRDEFNGEIPEPLRGTNPEDTHMRHAHLVTNVRKLFLWDGQYVTMSVPALDNDVDGYVVVAQNKRDTGIVAAGQIRRVQQSTPSLDQ